MNKKFTLHFDALLVIITLFVASLGLNAFLYFQFAGLTEDNQQLQWQGVEDSFNISSQANYIKQLEKKLKQIKSE